MAQTIRNIMTANPVCLPASTPIRDAARAMRDNDIGDVVIEKGGKLCGIVTDRDIVVRAIADSRNIESTDLEAICSHDVTAISPNQSDDEAVQVMRRKSIRRLPVVEDGRVVGIISLGDLAIRKDPHSALGKISFAAANA
jgi:CBS domain-containing protein